MKTAAKKGLYMTIQPSTVGNQPLLASLLASKKMERSKKKETNKPIHEMSKADLLQAYKDEEENNIILTPWVSTHDPTPNMSSYNIKEVPQRPYVEKKFNYFSSPSPTNCSMGG